MSQAEALAASAAVNVVIADDHGVVRGGLRLLLQRHDGVHVVGEAADLSST